MDCLNHKKLPKMPKKTASAGTWERFKKRIQEVKKHNSEIDKLRKKREKLISDYRALKSKHKGLKGVRKPPNKTASLASWESALDNLKFAVSEKVKKERIIEDAKKLAASNKK